VSADEEARQNPPVGIIVLAAGDSSRMGTPKQLLRFRGQSLLARAVDAALRSVCRPVVVVLGARAGDLRHEVEQFPVRVVENDRWAEGMGTSIGAGVEALLGGESSAEACVITLCDQPLVTAERINELVAAYCSTRAEIVAARYDRVAGGVPALFSRALFRELADLGGAEGAKTVITRRGERVVSVSVPEAAIDVDTQADYEKLLNGSLTEKPDM
jgi:molybdenum cofactor cytidylyltransferase